MRRFLSGLVALAGFGGIALGQGVAVSAAESTKPVEIMVLGAYHFDSPGLDVRNISADDVTSPRRQAELAALADSLARFAPTKVMVEAEGKGPDFDVPAYRTFTPQQLASEHSETVQIGFRVAHRMGLTAVQGIDEQGGPGELDYFPFDKVQDWIKAHGQEPQLAALFAEVEAEQKAFDAAQHKSSIPALLKRFNTPESVARGHQLYTGMIQFGDGENQPGAELNGYWHMRNAKIFGKLMQAAKPGDRVLVVFGAGHGYWLRQLAQTTVGYRLVDVVPYLDSADRKVGKRK